MATKAQLLTLFCLFLSLLNHPVKSQLTNSDSEFFFNGFTNRRDNITLNGAAEIEPSGLLRLTNTSYQILGHAFYSSPIQFKNSTSAKPLSFSTAFAFAIIPQYANSGGHGFAFTISPSKTLAGALPSQYLGLLNAGDVGNFSNHLFAVEFDTVQDFEFNDIDNNHVGIDINSLDSKKSVSVSNKNSSYPNFNLKSGDIFQAWIDYDSENNLIEVRLNRSSIKPIKPILSWNVDLSNVLEDSMYVGFSSSTGSLSSSHYILGWSFRIDNGEARSFYLEALPSLSRPKKKNRTALIVGVSIGTSLGACLVIGIAYYVFRRVKNADVIEPWEVGIGPHRFPYKELKKATRGFGEKEVIGFGGFGRVYKGTLPVLKTEIAVKRIYSESKQGIQEFVSEIASIGRLRHRNLVQLLGWCRRKDDLLLVYDFMPNGSLDKCLFNPSNGLVLTWEQRFKIIKGVASGLLYLHEEWEQTVIHRDIKAGNVLLDIDLNAKLGDFGLAKLHEHGSNPSTTRVVGTLGYLAPELTRTGKPTTNSDVFAFGALLLEVVCGRRPMDPKAMPEELMLVDWVWERWRDRAILDVVDPKLGGEFDEVEVVVVLKLGLMCSNDLPESRPSMRQVVRFLEGEIALPDVVENPNFHDMKKGGNVVAFEECIDLKPTSYFEKESIWSSAGDDNDDDGEDDNDVEIGRLVSPVMVTGKAQ